MERSAGDGVGLVGNLGEEKAGQGFVPGFSTTERL